MNPIDFGTFFFSFLKVLFVLAGSIYLIFSVVVIRQIYTMERSLVTSFSNAMRIVGYLHLGFSILVLIFFIVGL